MRLQAGTRAWRDGSPQAGRLAGTARSPNPGQGPFLQSLIPDLKPPPRFRTDLSPDDVRLVNGVSPPFPHLHGGTSELGQLSADQLLEYVQNLQKSAYALGLEEGESRRRAISPLSLAAKQFSRGKFLQIFEARVMGKPMAVKNGW